MRGSGRLALAIGLIVALGATAQAVDIDWVTVGDAGNTADDTGYGAVANDYRISRYEITNAQYREFLTAKAAVGDPYGLYNTEMWSSDYGCKIERTGPSGSYSYSVSADRANRPVNFVSFWDAARFANWIHNGQGSGDTESGAYINIDDEATFARQAGALFFLPTEDEWYKAAYYDTNRFSPGVGGYWEYPTMSDTTPTSEAPPGGANSANYFDGVEWALGPPYYTSEVGAYLDSESAYGTFDQGGNVWEWSEAALYTDYRCLRGGAWTGYWGYLSASMQGYGFYPSIEEYGIGFRLASPIPEPATVSLFGIAAAAAMLRRRKRRA